MHHVDRHAIAKGAVRFSKAGCDIEENKSPLASDRNIEDVRVPFRREEIGFVSGIQTVVTEKAPEGLAINGLC